MHRQQKTFTPSSFILPLIVTALVIFLASSANAQTIDPVNDLPQNNLPPSLGNLAEPARAKLAPAEPNDGAASRTPIRAQNTILPANASMNRSLNTDLSASNTPPLNQRIRVDLGAKRAEWASSSLERQQMLERKRAELASSTMERRSALNSAAQERMRQLAQNSSSVLSGALVRIKNISTSLRERADSISSRGIDTTDSVVLLDQIDELISQAQSSLSGIDVNIEYTLTSETPREYWVDTKAQFQTTAEIIRTIRPLLQEVVVALKDAIKSATSTEAI